MGEVDPCVGVEGGLDVGVVGGAVADPPARRGDGVADRSGGVRGGDRRRAVAACGGDRCPLGGVVGGCGLGEDVRRGATRGDAGGVGVGVGDDGGELVDPGVELVDDALGDDGRGDEHLGEGGVVGEGEFAGFVRAAGAVEPGGFDPAGYEAVEAAGLGGIGQEGGEGAVCAGEGECRA